MDFSYTEEQLAIRAAIEKICEKFDDEYWLKKDREGGFPQEFHQAIARDGWLGICMPQEYGGAGLGVAEAAIMLRAITESGACMAGASSVHINIFGLQPVVVFGTEEQKRRMLPPLIRGEEKTCFGVTEPNTGLDLTKLRTRAERSGDHYVVSGQKVWTSTAQVADRILIIARTTPLEQVKKKTQGLSLFYTKFDREHLEAREIEKMGRKAVDSNLLFIDALPVPVEDRIGEEGRGFEYLLHGLNPERVLCAAEAVGIGSAALRRATRYAKERVVFDRPIGKNQGVQHPLAECWMELEAAWMMTMQAAWLYDNGKECGAEANAAKYLAAEAGHKAARTAVLTNGGFGYAKDYHVERYFRESILPVIAPVTQQLILCHVAEKKLGLPKSY